MEGACLHAGSSASLNSSEYHGGSNDVAVGERGRRRRVADSDPGAFPAPRKQHPDHHTGAAVGTTGVDACRFTILRSAIHAGVPYKGPGDLHGTLIGAEPLECQDIVTPSSTYLTLAPVGHPLWEGKDAPEQAGTGVEQPAPSSGTGHQYVIVQEMEFIKGQTMLDIAEVADYTNMGISERETRAKCLLACTLPPFFMLDTRSFYHCDIKLDNLMAAKDGCVRILDLGLTRGKERGGGSDVHRYALGTVMFKLLCGVNACPYLAVGDFDRKQSYLDAYEEFLADARRRGDAPDIAWPAGIREALTPAVVDMIFKSGAIATELREAARRLTERGFDSDRYRDSLAWMMEDMENDEPKRHAAAMAMPPNDDHATETEADEHATAVAHAVVFNAHLFSELFQRMDRASKAAMRGVSHVTLSLVDEAVAVVASPSLGFVLTAEAVSSALQRWPGVKDLTLLGLDTDSAAATLAPLATADLGRLASLTLRQSYAPPALGEPDLSTWRVPQLQPQIAATLRVIDISGCIDLGSIDFLRGCAQLTCLRMLGAAGVCDLSLGACSETLEELWLAGCDQIHSLMPLKACLGLRKLGLRGSAAL
ncbi:hypothetical protein FOA52_002409 [Chlamydomonas sp. UWO 241]|nr:hypothetical protein FOA52_002409 [Chlamydomonas sp. UWO 241]